MKPTNEAQILKLMALALDRRDTSEATTLLAQLAKKMSAKHFAEDETDDRTEDELMNEADALRFRRLAVSVEIAPEVALQGPIHELARLVSIVPKNDPSRDGPYREVIAVLERLPHPGK
jgi:hypothetical protein